MQTVQIVINLLSEKGVSAARMCNELGFSSGLFYQWKKGSQSPSIEKLSKMAQYFGVTTDYLLGNEQKEKPSAEAESLSPEAIKLSKKIDRLSPANRAKLDELIDLYLSSQDKKK